MSWGGMGCEPPHDITQPCVGRRSRPGLMTMDRHRIANDGRPKGCEDGRLCEAVALAHGTGHCPTEFGLPRRCSAKRPKARCDGAVCRSMDLHAWEHVGERMPGSICIGLLSHRSTTGFASPLPAIETRHCSAGNPFFFSSNRILTSPFNGAAVAALLRLQTFSEQK
jgi:hypothetical protein